MVVIHNWFAYKLTVIWSNGVHLSFKIQEEFLKQYYNHPILSLSTNHILLKFERCHVTCLHVETWC
jgi:hypothetical protein